VSRDDLESFEEYVDFDTESWSRFEKIKELENVAEDQIHAMIGPVTKNFLIRDRETGHLFRMRETSERPGSENVSSWEMAHLIEPYLQACFHDTVEAKGILKPLKIIYEPIRSSIIYPLLPTVKDLLQYTSYESRTEEMAVTMLAQAVYSLVELRHKGILHCAVSASSFFINEDLNLQLGNFSACLKLDEEEEAHEITQEHTGVAMCSKRLEAGEDYSTVMSDFYSCAPESIFNPGYSPDMIDSWGLGILAHQLLSGGQPWDHKPRDSLTRVHWLMSNVLVSKQTFEPKSSGDQIADSAPGLIDVPESILKAAASASKASLEDGNEGAEKGSEGEARKIALVVDDSSVIRKVGSRGLGKLGFDVEHASDGLEGLEMMKLKNYDLVLCDFSMPNMDGFDCVSAYREWEKENRTSRALIIGMSSFPGEEERSKPCGMDNFKLKPLKFNDIEFDISEKKPAVAVSAGGGPAGRLLKIPRVSDLYYDFVSSLLKPYSSRMTLHEAMVHPIFENIDWGNLFEGESNEKVQALRDVVEEMNNRIESQRKGGFE
jgi:CheY-like chemotaxis protein